MGKSGIEADWAEGSWKMITEAKPEWKNTTVALLNYELPAKRTLTNELKGSLTSSNETQPVVSSLLGEVNLEDLLSQKGAIFNSYNDAQPMSDACCYQFEGGVPCYQVNASAGIKVPAPSTYYTP